MKAYADEGIQVAHPSRMASPGSASQARTAPALSASRNSGGVSSAYSKNSYPWYLQTRYIVGLIILLLLAVSFQLLTERTAREERKGPRKGIRADERPVALTARIGTGIGTRTQQ